MLRLLLLFLFSTNLFAAEWYVRAGSTGTGVDWANALPALPSTLTRGDTYYIAGGSYPSYTFDDPVSGSLLITIKKATEESHGTNTGWNTSYGTTQANFTAPLTFSTAYWLFDGQIRNESDWFAGADYGFKVTNNAGDYGPTVYMYGSNVTVAYAWMVGETVNAGTTTRGYVMDYESPTTTTGTVVTHSFAQKSSNHFFLRNVNGAIVEYSASSDADSNPFNHGESVNLYGYFGKSDNVIVRYNIFKDNFLGDVGTAVIAIVGATGNEIYGNVFYNNNTTDGAIGWNGTGPSGYAVSNTKIYNNTFGGGGGYNQGINFESTSNSATNIVQNNIFCGSGTYSFTQVTASFNAFCGSSAQGTTNAQINMPTSVFINFASNDFRLNDATTSGASLASPYNLDMLNTTRGVDASWDRGAFEYVTPLPPFVEPATPVFKLTFDSTQTVDGSLVVLDASTYKNHCIGNASFAPTIVPGKIGNGAYFDNTDFLTCPWASQLSVSSQFTFSAWVKYDDSVNGLPVQYVTERSPILTKQSAGGAPGSNVYTLESHGGVATGNQAKAYFGYSYGTSGGYASVQSPATLTTTGVWHHFVGVYTGSRIKLWIDGIKEKDVAWATNANISNAPLLIGRAIGVTNGTKGIIDEVKIYNTGLSDSDVLILYNQQGN